jgi:hypothetical protein
MAAEKNIELEIGTKSEPTIAFRIDPADKALYEELRYIHKVTNLSRLCRDAISEVIRRAAAQIKGEAG